MKNLSKENKDESITKIYSTNNYDKFKFKPTHNNRYKISPTHVKSLVDSITKVGYMPSNPILINKDFEILDGQTRFLACKVLKLPIIYLICENSISDNLIIQYTQVQNRWGVIDFIAHHAHNGIEVYEKLLEITEQYKLPISITLDLCIPGGLGNKRTPKIKQGELLVIRENYLECLEYLLSFKMLPFYKTTRFVRAIILFFNRATPKQKMKLFKRHLSITSQYTTTAYTASFVNIVNIRSSGDDKYIS